MILASCSPVGGQAISGFARGGSNGNGTVDNRPVRNLKFWVAGGVVTGNLGGRAGANSFCSTDYTNQSGTFCTGSIFAFLSVSAADEVRDLPALYDFNGTSPVTDSLNTSFATFNGMIAGAATSLGTFPGGGAPVIGTGTAADGSLAANNCSGFTSNAGTTTQGTGFATDSRYLDNGTVACNNFQYIYCMCL